MWRKEREKIGKMEEEDGWRSHGIYYTHIETYIADDDIILTLLFLYYQVSIEKFKWGKYYCFLTNITKMRLKVSWICKGIIVTFLCSYISPLDK